MDDEELRQKFAAWLAPTHTMAIPRAQLITRRLRRRRVRGAVVAGIATLAAVAGGGILATSLGGSSGSPASGNTTTAHGAATSSHPSDKPSVTGSPPTATRACQTADLAITNPRKAVTGMTGTTVALVFRNIGTTFCSLVGWPTIATPGHPNKVQYQTVTGAAFEVAVTHVKLAPGSTAASSLVITAPGNTSGCNTKGSWAVTPPGARQHVNVVWPMSQGACDHGTIIVSPIYRGSSPVNGTYPPSARHIPPMGPYSTPPPTR